MSVPKPRAQDYVNKTEYHRDWQRWNRRNPAYCARMNALKRQSNTRLKKPRLYMNKYEDAEGRVVIKIGQTIIASYVKSKNQRREYGAKVSVVAEWPMPGSTVAEREALEQQVILHLEDEGFEKLPSVGRRPTERFYLGDEDLDTLVVNVTAFILSEQQEE